MADLLLGLARTTLEGAVTMAKSAMEVEKLQPSVQQDLMLISDEFQMMQSFLEDAKDRVTDNVTRTLVRQVRSTALDLEDCIETIVHLDNKPPWIRGVLPSCCMAGAGAAPVSSLHDAGARIQLLKARVEALRQSNIMRYGHIGDSAVSKPAGQMQHKSPASTATDSAYKKSRRVNLVKLINNEDKVEDDTDEEDSSEESEEYDSSEELEDHDLEVDDDAVEEEKRHLQLNAISVFGTQISDHAMMSIKKAFDDPQTFTSFKCRAWVKLVHPFDPQEFIRSLLAQFCKNYYRADADQDNTVVGILEVMVATDNALIQQFKRQIRQKYLVVLDDVFTMVDWEAVRVYLPDYNNGSCIIVNTQELAVARLCVGHPYRVSMLKKFSPDDIVFVLFKQDAARKDEETGKQKIARRWLDRHPLIGREVDLTWFNFYLRSGGPGRVVSVWGMPGVGKSFLVKHVYYQNRTIGYLYFYKYGWVNVSRPFDLVDLSRSLLLDLNPGFLRCEDPIQECREYLSKHKCFVVIDGLQSTEEWDLAKAALELGTSTRQCVIVITNEQSVAKYCATPNHKYVRNIKSLEVNYAIELFKKVAVNNPRVWRHGRHMLHKFGGLPKVILAVSDMFKSQHMDSVINGNLVSQLEAKAPFFIIESLEDLSDFRSCPDFIKPCIFYLSIFPLNHTIRRRRLLRRWIAEGYSRGNKESTAEDDGEKSFSKLVNLSMIQVPSIVYQRIPLCQVNGFHREYIISRSIGEDIVCALEGHCRMNLQCTGRHLAIHKSWHRERNVFESIDFTRLRSLTVFGRWESFFISQKMRLLRVLDLEDVSSGVTNGEVDRMVRLLPCLKFLSLRRCKGITDLPDSLGELTQLQTLDIRETSIIKLPKSIVKLQKLQYIRAGTTPTVDDETGTVQDPPATTSAAVTADSSDDDDMVVERIPSSWPQGAAESQLLSDDDDNMVERIPSSSPLIAADSPPLSDDDDDMFERLFTKQFRAALVPNWLSNLCQTGAKLDDSCHNNGVKVPRGIGKLENLHTLGVVNIATATGKDIFEEVKNLTQLHKLGVSGINKNNIQNFFSAISGLVHLESLSLQLDLNEEDNHTACLEGISPETLRSLWSLKLYGLRRKLPVWTKELQKLRKLSLHMTMLTQKGIDLLGSLKNLENLRLFLSGLQDGELQFRSRASLYSALVFLEISCSSRLHARITFHGRGIKVRVLRIRCWRSSFLQISGLDHLGELEEVWLSGPYADALKRHLESQLAICPVRPGRSKPILRLEKPRSSPWLMTRS